MDIQMIIGIGEWKMMIYFGDVYLKDMINDSYMKSTSMNGKTIFTLMVKILI